MVRPRVFSCSESDGPGTVKSYKAEARCCEQHKLRGMRYMVDMRDMRDNAE